MRGNSRLVLIFATGFCAIPAQVILMREFLLVFGGNEIFIGLFLAIWMLITSLGSVSARYFGLNSRQVPICTIILAWIPIVLLYSIDLMRNRLFLPGIEPGIILIMISLLLFLIPFCFLSGLLFASIAVQMAVSGKPGRTDTVYGVEALGSMAGGFLFSLVLVYQYDNFRSAALVAFLSNLPVIFFWREKIRRPVLILFTVIMTGLMILILITGSRFPRKYLFSGQELQEVRDTPYGNLAVTVASGQTNFYENNSLLFSTGNPLVSEEAVHFAMLQHPGPKQVLLISGGVAGLTKEILKYKSVKRLDYIEIDPVIFEMGKQFTEFSVDSRIRLIVNDPRIYIRSTKIKYDVIIVFLPSPSSFQINRYYTLEFMRDARKCLNIRGIFTFSLPLTGSYLNEGSVIIYSSLYNTCRSIFRNVHIFPGQNSYFVGTDRVIKKDIGQRIDSMQIKTDYVNSYYIDESEMERNSKEIVRQIRPGANYNTDFKPVVVAGFYEYLSNYFRMEFKTFRFYALVIISLIILGLAMSSPPISGMFAAGFTVSALQVILILSFQIVCGYIYRSIGIFAAVFMAGLAMGAVFRRRLLPDAPDGVLIYLQVILAGIAALVPLLIQFSTRLSELPVVVHFLYITVIFFMSGITGIVFSISVRATGKSGTGRIGGIYGADLAGASVGAFVTVLVLIPFAGIRMVPYLTALLNIAVAAVMIIRKRQAING